MITKTTPLTALAEMLPATAAAVLLNQSGQVQEHVLTLLRSCFVYWETEGYEMDPIVREGVLNAFVVAMAQMSNAHELQQLAIASLQTTVQIQRDFIEAMQ